jgi:hypothetical protein
MKSSVFNELYNLNVSRKLKSQRFHTFWKGSLIFVDFLDETSQLQSSYNFQRKYWFNVYSQIRPRIFFSAFLISHNSIPEVQTRVCHFLITWLKRAPNQVYPVGRCPKPTWFFSEFLESNWVTADFFFIFQRNFSKNTKEKFLQPYSSEKGVTNIV